MPVNLACGRCLWCRLESARQWAVRASLEATLYERNCFVTLTYNDSHLPKYGFLDYEEPVRFVKRLRERYGAGIRSFGCAEYGEKFGRPHYHICFLNFDFADKKFWKRSPRGDNYYISEELQSLWIDTDTKSSLGFAAIGEVTYESAGYVGRYCTKKVSGPRSDEHYEYIDWNTGEIFDRPRERLICLSRAPGIGKPWFEKFHGDVYPLDEMVVRGKVTRPPKYFDRLYEKMDPSGFKELKFRRREKMEEALKKEPESRLGVREAVLMSRFKQLKRSFEIHV